MSGTMTGTAGARDHRIDWLRGLALASIFINHMPGNRFENWTLRNFGFSDAAEIFVLLAGVAAALAFFRRFERGETWDMSVKALRRTAKLYVAHVGSTVGAVVLFLAAAAVFENQGYLDLIGVAPLMESPGIGLIGVLTGGYQLGYFNILPLYVVLLAFLPAMLWLAVRDLRLLVGASLTLYLATQILQLRMPSFPDEFAWFFNPSAWQLLFVSGLVLGVMRLRGTFVPYHAVAFWLAVAYIGFSFVWMVFSLGGTLTQGLVPAWMDTLRKTNLAPLRLLHLYALGYVLVHSRAWDWLMRISAADPVLTKLGRNSLPVFVTASFCSMTGYIALVWLEVPSLAVEIALLAAGLTVMWVAATFSEAGVAATLTRMKAAIATHAAVAPAVTVLPFMPVDDEPTTTPTGRRK